MRISDWSSDVCSSDLVDANRFIASQFQVQSIPTVYAIFQGQPVANLTNARTESQLKAILDQLLAQLPIESEASARAVEIAPLIEMGEGVLADGDGPRAASLFRSEEHTSEPQSLMRISYAVFCLKRKNKRYDHNRHH